MERVKPAKVYKCEFLRLLLQTVRAQPHWDNWNPHKTPLWESSVQGTKEPAFGHQPPDSIVRGLSLGVNSPPVPLSAYIWMSSPSFEETCQAQGGQCLQGALEDACHGAQHCSWELGWVSLIGAGNGHGRPQTSAYASTLSVDASFSSLFLYLQGCGPTQLQLRSSQINHSNAAL